MRGLIAIWLHRPYSHMIYSFLFKFVKILFFDFWHWFLALLYTFIIARITNFVKHNFPYLPRLYKFFISLSRFYKIDLVRSWICAATQYSHYRVTEVKQRALIIYEFKAIKADFSSYAWKRTSRRYCLIIGLTIIQIRQNGRFNWRFNAG